jgi:acyl-CoA synthetase (AMP-forming)/AMP-acid ligase II
VTYLPVVPPIVLGLATHPSALSGSDRPALRVVLSGAAPLDDALAADVSRRLECPVVQGYGLTETSPVTHATRIADARGAVPGVGPPVPNTESTVVDIETGRPCEPLERGEIWVRGPQVMRGYLNRPEETAAVLTPDGWLRTGDVGYADETGCFFVVDRVKELIKYKGHAVAPAELEAVLLGHPAIADAAVVAQPDAESGEVPKAFVVLRGHADAPEIIDYVAARVGRHKRIHMVEFVSQIPRSAAGKILRRMLAQR